MIEYRYWNKIEAERELKAMMARGIECQISSDGRGVFVRVNNANQE